MIYNQEIKLFVMDVDGTLTDGQIHISAGGELFKSFNIKDGYGIRDILPKYGVEPVIITGRQSTIVERRAEELDIKHLYQGVKDKVSCLRELAATLDIPLSQIACIGDDLNDFPMIELCGVTGCPVDAVQEVKDRCDYICTASGGHGAVREFINWLIREKIPEAKKND